MKINRYQKFNLGLGLLILIFLSACSSTKQLKLNDKRSAYSQLSVNDKQLADTLLKYAMENEGLFTLSGRIKPMSSVYDLRFLLAQKDSTLKGKATVADVNSKDYQRVMQYQRVVNALQFGDVCFVFHPFKITYDGYRNASINVYRQSLVDSLVKANASFYGQFGFVPGTPAPMLIAVTEYEKNYDRFRSYGNLFGYPAHAVDFFVQAAIHNDEKKEFVKRDFFNMPVFSRENGRFVYAIPKDSKPGTLDLAIKERAATVLVNYKLLREKFTDQQGKVAYYPLFVRLLQLADAKP